MRILPLICSYPHGFNTIIIRRAHKKINLIFPEIQESTSHFRVFPSETADMLQSRPVYRNAALHEQKQSGSAFVTKPPCTFLLIKNLIRKPYFAESMHLPAYLRS